MMRLTRIALLALAVSGCSIAAAQADDASRLALARQVVVDSHATDTMRQVLPALLGQIKPMLARQGADQKTIDDLMGRFQAKIEPELGRFADLVAQIYAREFSEEDLGNLDAFYKSPTGQHLIAKQPAIVQGMNAVGTQWGQNIAREVLQDYQRDKLNAAGTAQP